MKYCFVQREYPKKLIDNEMGTFVLTKEKGLRNKRLTGIWLVVRYHRILRQLARIVQEHPNLLHLNAEVKWSHLEVLEKLAITM